MILHTIVPLEVVFAKQEEIEEQKIEKILYDGEIVEAINQNGEYKITRLISSNPKKFLNNNYAPYKSIPTNSIKFLK